MKFGPLPLGEAEGAVLAHSIQQGALRLRKGRRLGAVDIAALRAEGVQSVVAARLEPGDLAEDESARQIGAAAAGPGLRISAPFAGRVNVYAETAGLFQVDAGAVDALNAIDPAITLATLPQWARVTPRQMLATIKIIPYAAPGDAVAKAVAQIAGALRLHPFAAPKADLILTELPGQPANLARKAEAVLAQRMAALGGRLGRVQRVAHDSVAVESAIRQSSAPWLMILTGSATSDIADTAPAALVAAGGRIERFGMPVDPGNLLFIGQRGAQQVIGLPGCARSPALNGADFVLARLAARLVVDDAVIRGMGVGGLLKEIPTRPMARGDQPQSGRPSVAIMILAAGASRRMQGADKLMESVGGQPMIRHAAEAALASDADHVLAMLPALDHPRAHALDGLALARHAALHHAEGMGGTLRDGLAALPEGCDAVILALADMPEITPAYYNALVAAFDPAEGREICRATSEDGTPGHPVLFGRRFFESLAGLGGDQGARAVLAAGADYLVDVVTPGKGALVDLDTTQDWAEWRALNPR